MVDKGRSVHQRHVLAQNTASRKFKLPKPRRNANNVECTELLHMEQSLNPIANAHDIPFLVISVVQPHTQCDVLPTS